MYKGESFLEKIKWKLRNIPLVICIGYQIVGWDKMQIKLIENIVYQDCQSINFYGELEDCLDKTVKEILFDTNNFKATRKGKTLNETIYIYDTKLQ